MKNHLVAPLKEFDDEKAKLPRHHQQSSKDDEFETPEDLYYKWIHKYHLAPQLDVFATVENSKCPYFFTREDNGLIKDYLLPDGTKCDIWCNHPHTLHKQVINHNDNQYRKLNINIMMLLPNNVQRDTIWHEIIEPNRFTLENQEGYIHVYPIKGSIRFLKNKKPTKDSSRNAYSHVIWRKKTSQEVTS